MLLPPQVIISLCFVTIVRGLHVQLVPQQSSIAEWNIGAKQQHHWIDVLANKVVIPSLVIMHVYLHSMISSSFFNLHFIFNFYLLLI